MKSMDFRQQMLVKLRAFEGWAWKDELENPDDWKNMDFKSWVKMFNEYLENDDG